MKVAPLPAALCCALVLSGCGALGQVKDPAAGGSPATATARASSGTTPPSTTEPPVTETSAAAPTAASSVPGDAKTFTDPAGAYTMMIGARWVRYTKETKSPLWFIDAADGDFRPNVNIVTESLLGPAEGISMETYLRLSVSHLVKDGFTVVRKGQVPGANSARLGAIEYTGDPANRGKPVRFLALVDLSRTSAAVVTLSSDPSAYTQHRIAAQPYMITIKAA